MVYLLAPWGMGDHDQRTQDYSDSSTDFFLPSNNETLRGEIDLLPLNNQVGGHTRLMLLNRSTICKPLNYRELDFYQNLQDDITDFVPEYKGVMQATLCTGEKMEKRYSPSFRDEHVRGKNERKRKRSEDVLKMRVHHTSSPKDVLRNISQTNNSNKQYFLMLENITSHYFRPSILDLKMGTRQYGDDASADKRKKQIAKCAASTSASLGVRLCGMQVYDAEKDRYYKRDKYWGRELNEEGFKNALYMFFHNGYGLRISVIRKVISKLDALRRIIEKQSCYRFYSCSLLIVFEGSVGDPTESKLCKPYSHDFHQASADTYDADTSNSSMAFNYSNNELSQDSHLNFGEAVTRGTKASSFCPISEETVFLNSSPPSKIITSSPLSVDSWMLFSNSSSDEYSFPEQLSSSSSNDNSLDNELNASHGAKRRCSLQFPLDEESEEEQGMGVKNIPKRPCIHEDIQQTSIVDVDVKIIDFAHTSFAKKNEINSKTEHQGPDGGFLKGLDSLKRLLSEILATEN